jgi:hypothetical protein
MKNEPLEFQERLFQGFISVDESVHVKMGTDFFAEEA